MYLRPIQEDLEMHVASVSVFNTTQQKNPNGNLCGILMHMSEPIPKVSLPHIKLNDQVIDQKSVVLLK